MELYNVFDSGEWKFNCSNCHKILDKEESWPAPKMKKLTIEFIRSEFAKEGYKLLTTEYKNAHQKLTYICPEGHKHSITWNNWKEGDRCPYCYGNVKLTIEFIRTEFAKEGYTLLAETYENNKQKLEYICPRGHKHFITWRSWSSKNKGRCPYCHGNAKLTIEFIREEFTKEGYILLTKVYGGAHQKLEYICPRGHKHSISWSNWNSRNKYRCPKCNNNVSKWEKEVKSFLDESNINYVPNDRTQLVNQNTGHNFELDIWFPDLNKAIECNGVYWHSKDKAIRSDKVKCQLCEDQGIDLLVITDEEWKKDVDKCKRKVILFLNNCQN